MSSPATDREHRRKSVSFAPETKPPAPVPEIQPKDDEPLDGIVGQLEIYKSGAVKMRLGHGIVLDVSSVNVCINRQYTDVGMVLL